MRRRDEKRSSIQECRKETTITKYKSKETVKIAHMASLQFNEALADSN